MAVLDEFLGDKEDDMKIGVLGPSKAGKTTLVRFLETGEEQLDAPKTTLGFHYRDEGFTYNKIRFKIYDAGGQQIYQEIFWEMVVTESNVIFYVVDSTITQENEPELLQLHIEQFNNFCDLLDEESKVIILLNKQDLKELNPMGPDEFKRHYDLEKIKVKAMGLELISAKYGDRITDVLNWLTDVI